MSMRADLEDDFVNGLSMIGDSIEVFNALYDLWSSATQNWDDDFRAESLRYISKRVSLFHANMINSKLDKYGEFGYLD